MGGGLGGGGAPSRTCECVIDMAPLVLAADEPRPRAAAADCGEPRTDMPPRLCISCAAEDGAPRLTMPPPRTPRFAVPRPREVMMGEAPLPLTTLPLEVVGIPRTPRDATGVPPRVATIPRVGVMTPRPREGTIAPAPRDPRTGEPRMAPRCIGVGEPRVLVGVITDGLGAILFGATWGGL